MGEFSAQWLSLREPVDHAARSAAVRNALLADLRACHGQSLQGLRVLDIGCGSGSNLRAIAPLLGGEQHWTLLDYDEDLLAAARAALKVWSDKVVSEQTDSLRLVRGDVDLQVHFRIADLSRDIESVLAEPVDLVTASALFDLVSRQWVDRFCQALSSPLYAVLSFDGQMRWEPGHALDDLVVQAFAEHQTSDKGFGAALGPAAGEYLRHALQYRGFEVAIDKSPWDIDTLPSAFHDMLIDGIAQAVIETGRCSAAELEAWLATHKTAGRCVVGHDDLYASRGLR